MRHWHCVAVDGIVVQDRHCVDAVDDQLVAGKIEIDPAVARPPLGASHERTIECPRRGKIGDGHGEVEAGIHGCSAASAARTRARTGRGWRLRCRALRAAVPGAGRLPAACRTPAGATGRAPAPGGHGSAATAGRSSPHDITAINRAVIRKRFGGKCCTRGSIERGAVGNAGSVEIAARRVRETLRLGTEMIDALAGLVRHDADSAIGRGAT